MKDYTTLNGEKLDGSMVDVDLELWKKLEEQYVGKLLQGRTLYRQIGDSDQIESYQEAGLSQEIIDGIEIFEAGESVEVCVRSGKGFFDPSNPDAKCLALSRWLICNSGERDTPKFREQKNKLDFLMAAGYARGLLEKIDDLEPDAASGKKSKIGAVNRGGVAVDKAEVAAIVKIIHQSYTTIAALEGAPELKAYKNKWSGRSTIRNWIKKALPNRQWSTGRPRSTK